MKDKSPNALRAIKALRRQIAARKQAQQMLKERDEELQALFNKAPVCIFLLDGEVRLQKGNSTLTRFFGHNQEKMLGHRCGSAFRCVHSLDDPAGCGYGPHCKSCIIRKTVLDTFHTGESHLEIEADMTTHYNGRSERRVFLISTTLVAVMDRKQVLVCMENTTERKQAEEALRHAEKRFRTMFEEAPFMYIITRNLNGAAIIVDCNELFQATLGHTRAEVLDQPLDKFYTEESRHRLYNGGGYQKAMTIGLMDEERELIARDGRIIKTLLRALPEYDAHGALLGTRAMFIDITQHKKAAEEKQKLEAQLHQAQKLESIGRLAGGVAHDFNNMLGVIIGHADLALEELDPTRPPAANLRGIHQAAKRSADLTRQLLAFARQQAVAPRILDLNDTVAGMLKMLQRLIGEDIDVAWLPGAGLWPLKLDPSQIDQMLANLCVNARDAIAGVGKITIETENVVIDEARRAVQTDFLPGEYVLLAVSDDGCGMERDILEHIFEPFFTTKELGKGTGLGLATVYGIVKQNEGFINVYSEPGSGTTFKIYLPRYGGEVVKAAAAAPLEIPKGCGETVLLVEDESEILNVSRAMLERLGYHVLAAGTPGKALNLAKNRSGAIHLLITDVVMPEMNGRQLEKLLKELMPDLKCLFSSGYTADVIAHRGVLDEGVQFLQKPFSMKDLAFKVREVLEQE